MLNTHVDTPIRLQNGQKLENILLGTQKIQINTPFIQILIITIILTEHNVKVTNFRTILTPVWVKIAVLLQCNSAEGMAWENLRSSGKPQIKTAKQEKFF